MHARHSYSNPEPKASSAAKDASAAAAPADLGASIAEHSIRLGHMYLDRAGMFSEAGDDSSAVQDMSRAETLYNWALQAAEATNLAGHDVLRPQLEQLKNALDSCRLSKTASNTH